MSGRMFGCIPVRIPVTGANRRARAMEGSSMDTLTPLKPALSQLVVACVVLAICASSMEALWYLVVARELYFETIGALMREQFDVFVAFLFYVFYALGATVLALQPALRARSWRAAMLGGAAYGFSCFAAHDLTDLADLKGYSTLIAVVDIAWGTFMTTTASLLAFLAARRVG
jgi:uncharacterized membrane protein